MRWLLPEAIEDVLPDDAAKLEALRRKLLDIFAGHGFDYVIPPMLEYLESLLTGSGHDLDLKTFKLPDQLSGRSMGIRADMTPQVARIDAHLLNHSGVVRLCYCGSVLHTVPDGFQSTREPIQIGAEIYGHDGLEADIETLRLLAEGLSAIDLATSRIVIGHVAIFRVLVKHAGLEDRRAQDLFLALQAKDVTEIRGLVVGLEREVQHALTILPELYGGIDVLDHARTELKLPGPAYEEIKNALTELERLGTVLVDLPISFDLSDLRGYHYHSGVSFAAYASGCATAIALGGRYDDVGKAFGRARAATGFSMDLRELTRLTPTRERRAAILAPWIGDAVQPEVTRLRAMGERVVVALPGHDGNWLETGCDRMLVKDPNGWVVKQIEGA